MAKKKKDTSSILYKPFTLYYGNDPYNFNDVDEFIKETGISGAVAKDLIEGKCTHYKFWCKNPQMHPLQM